MSELDKIFTRGYMKKNFFKILKKAKLKQDITEFGKLLYPIGTEFYFNRFKEYVEEEDCYGNCIGGYVKWTGEFRVIGYFKCSTEFTKSGIHSYELHNSKKLFEIVEEL